MEAELLGNLVNQTSVNPTCFLHKFVVQTFVAKFITSHSECVTVFSSCCRDEPTRAPKNIQVQETVRMKKLGEMQLTKKETGNRNSQGEKALNQDQKSLFLESLVEKGDG
jgi:hypothetical protein